MTKDNDFDIAFITALKEELNPLLEIIKESFDYEKTFHNKYVYYKAKFPLLNGKNFKAVLTCLPKYGPKEAHIKTLSLKHFNPKICCMVGICAGWKVKGVLLGDVLVADKAYEPLNAAKKLKGGELRPDLTTYGPPKFLLDWIQNYDDLSWVKNIKATRPLPIIYQAQIILHNLFIGLNEDRNFQIRHIKNINKIIKNFDEVYDFLVKYKLIITSGKISNPGRSYLEKFVYKGRQPFKPELKRNKIKVDTSTFATYPFVLEEDLFFETEINKFRKLKAVDMEIAAFYEACADIEVPGIAAKGVVDYADKNKNNIFHNYSAEASVRYIQGFLTHYEESIRNLSIKESNKKLPRDLYEKPIYNDSTVFHNSPNAFCNDKKSFRNLEYSLTNGDKIIGFLSTSPEDPYCRYHLGHFFFVKAIDSILAKTRNLSLLICDSTSQIKQEHDPNFDKRIDAQKYIWSNCFDSFIQVCNIGDYIRNINIDDRYKEIPLWLIIKTTKLHNLGSNSIDNLKQWRYLNISPPIILIQELANLFDLKEDNYNIDELLSISYILVSRPRWFNEYWFVQFMKAVCEKDLNTFLHVKEDLIFIEGIKNRTAWDSMAFCANYFSLPKFPKRVYIKNLLCFDCKAPMKSGDPDNTIFLSKIDKPFNYDGNFINYLLEEFFESHSSEPEKLFRTLLIDSAIRLAQNQCR